MGLPIDHDANLCAIASHMGWMPSLLAKNHRAAKPCNACRHFSMRMIKNNEADSFGHLIPYCNHPDLPGDSGLQTQFLSSCNEWGAK